MDYTHKHTFQIRPYDDMWCLVTKDNEGYDITPCVDLTEEQAVWMRDVLNAGVLVKHNTNQPFCS